MSSPAASNARQATSRAAAPASAASSSAAASSRAASAASSSAAASSGPAGSSAVAVSSRSSNSAASAASTSSASAALASSASSLSASSIPSLSSASPGSVTPPTTAAANIASAAASESGSTSKGLSKGTIGGIVGGAVGGVLLLGLIWFLWRRRKDKKNWVPPPPPREMSYAPSTMQRQRASSKAMMGGGGMDRASSFSTLLQPGPSSQYGSHSRQPSYYTSYPVATPSTQSHDTSPQLSAAMAPGVSSASGSSSESSPPLTGVQTPVQGPKPILVPIDTGLRRDGSDSSGSQSAPRHKTSVDKLRHAAGASSSRAPSPVSANGHERNNSETGSSRGTSPHPSLYGYPASPGPRQSYTSSLAPGGSMSRPYSSQSLSSALPRMGGAPHQRHVQVELPRLLGARPDVNADFFPGMPRSHDSAHWHTVDGHMRQHSRAPSESDFGPPPGHMRRQSGLSATPISPASYSRQGHQAV